MSEPIKWAELTERERDALVAEKVMELEIDKDGLTAYPKYWIPGYDHTYLRAVPHYTTSIADAWAVVEKLREQGYMFRICETLGGQVSVWFNGARDVPALSNTAPEAICLAALKACGIEVE